MFKEAVDGRKGVIAFESEEHFEWVHYGNFQRLLLTSIVSVSFFWTFRCLSSMVRDIFYLPRQDHLYLYYQVYQLQLRFVRSKRIVLLCTNRIRPLCLGGQPLQKSWPWPECHRLRTSDALSRLAWTDSEYQFASIKWTLDDEFLQPREACRFQDPRRNVPPAGGVLMHCSFIQQLLFYNPYMYSRIILVPFFSDSETSSHCSKLLIIGPVVSIWPACFLLLFSRLWSQICILFLPHFHSRHDSSARFIWLLCICVMFFTVVISLSALRHHPVASSALK